MPLAGFFAMDKLPINGCVYFFKHKGISPIKIGFSGNESCLARFESFKTYAPYGAEIVGVIECFDPAALEKRLHYELRSVRLKGEFFDISVDDAQRIIDREMSDAQREEMSIFLRNYAFSKNRHVNLKDKTDIVIDIPSRVARAWSENPRFNKSELAKQLNVSRVHIHRIVKQLKVK
jgi:hypothetical protein